MRAEGKCGGLSPLATLADKATYRPGPARQTHVGEGCDNKVLVQENFLVFLKPHHLPFVPPCIHH